MEQNKKIIWINLAILLIYTVIIQLTGELQSDHSHKSLFILMYTMYAIIAHLGINIFVTIFFFYKDDNDKGKVLALSSLLIILVGFSTCLGNAFLT
jgi:hypothetical protein